MRKTFEPGRNIDGPVKVVLPAHRIVARYRRLGSTADSQRGAAHRHPGNGQFRTDITSVCDGIRSAELSSIIENEVVGPLKIFGILDLDFLKGASRVNVSEDRTLPEVDAHRRP